MNESEARDWLCERWPSAMPKLEHYVSLLLAEGDRQNLISAASSASIWARHIVDSAQLISLAPAGSRSWLDVGSGAGLPGIVIALLANVSVTLVEPRARRAAFLSEVVCELDLANATVRGCKVSQLPAAHYDVIVARAFASLEDTLDQTARYGHDSTTWVLPRGRSSRLELAAARRSWHGSFHVEPSVTDDGSGIVVASGLNKRTRV